MKRLTLVAVVAGVAGVAGWLLLKPAAPPSIPFAKVEWRPLKSVLATNGRAEPVDWTAVVSSMAGRVERVAVQAGDRVAAGSLIATLADPDSEQSIAAARARVEQLQAEAALAQSGGAPAEAAAIDGAIRKLEVERSVALRELESLERLLAKQAATRAERDAAQDRVRGLDVQLAAEKGRRAALVSNESIRSASARVREAEAALAAVIERSKQVRIVAPRGGTVYDLEVKAGDWMDAGKTVAKVGDTSRMRVLVYVDEPDLGRVAAGMKLTITWDALPGKAWDAMVERAPLTVTAMGTRMVGEVVTVAENPDRNLPPGANVNASILSREVANALTIPKAALRRESGQLGVYILEGSQVAWRPIVLGVSSATEAEVNSGLKEGDEVAMPSEVVLTSGMAVEPVRGSAIR